MILHCIQTKLNGLQFRHIYTHIHSMPHTGNRHSCALIEGLATKQKSLQTGQIYS